MKDLKHLIWFEDLLQQANNELVQRAAAEGQLALGYNCYYIPEVLLNLPGCFSSRLRAPNSGTAEIASYYMTNRNCPYVRCILERAIEGGFNYLNALFGAEGCAAMERMEEHFALLKPVKNDRPQRHGDDRSLREILNGDTEGQDKRARRRDLCVSREEARVHHPHRHPLRNVM